MNKVVFLIIGLILGILGTYVVVSQSTSPSASDTSQNSDALDAHFIEQMIPHHEDAITMAKLAQTKAKRPEVKQLADEIISAQESEISDMKAWYTEWFGRDLPTDSKVMQHHGMGNDDSLHMGMSGSSEDIAKLENAEDFDRAFVEHMIPHHQMAVMMANMLKDGTKRQEMKQLAENIITSQTNEIELMRSWLQEWE